jgi:hypothetical protein
MTAVKKCKDSFTHVIQNDSDIIESDKNDTRSAVQCTGVKGELCWSRDRREFKDHGICTEVQGQLHNKVQEQLYRRSRSKTQGERLLVCGSCQ